MAAPSPLVVLKHTLVELASSGVPVSFYDARLVVRQVKQLRVDLDDELVGLLILLHDGGQTTDGARQVLSEVLRGIAKRRAQERELSARPIFLADAGKRARIGAGESLKLHLEERREHGYRWEHKPTATGALYVRRLPESDDIDLAVLEVKAQKSGAFSLELEERRPKVLEPSPDKPAAIRRFTLIVLCE